MTNSKSAGKRLSVFRKVWLIYSAVRQKKKSAAKKKSAEEPKPEAPEEKALTLEDVRAVCADKSRSGFTAEVKAILNKHGVEKLSEVNPAEYKALLAEVEVLGNAG